MKYYFEVVYCFNYKTKLNRRCRHHNIEYKCTDRIFKLLPQVEYIWTSVLWKCTFIIIIDYMQTTLKQSLYIYTYFENSYNMKNTFCKKYFIRNAIRHVRWSNDHCCQALCPFCVRVSKRCPFCVLCLCV